MGSETVWVILAALGGAVAALLVTGLVTLLRRRSRSRADLETQLAASRREVDGLRVQLEELTALLTLADQGQSQDQVELETEPAFVITDAGRTPAVADQERTVVPDRLVLTATLGEPLVKAAAFGHGLRRALSARSRNRIWFEMRREVRSARKRRRRDVRDHLRQVRADERDRAAAQQGLA